MNNVEEKFNEWLERATDDTVKAQLETMKTDEKARINAFYKDLGFGTGGLRGELGAGSNCLNVYTIRKVTQGIADCMKHYGYTRAAVSCDSRNCSDFFKDTVAEVFAANGIKTVVSRSLMPTPFLSYMTRETNADIGVMITASHNPARYNGYKVYGADGCQLTDARATEMIGYINAIDAFAVKTEKIESYVEKGLVEYVSDELVDKYLGDVYSHANASAQGLRVTYSALNGAGYVLVPEILRRIGVGELCFVSEQCKPDGNFTTCPYPNPEKKEALALGLKRAQENDSDILIATDPDCDRVGIAVKHHGEYKLMSGNEVGVLLTDYLLKKKKANGTLAERPVIVKTIVTTELVRKVAAPFGAEVKDVLTGFKYIGDVIAKLEAKGEENRYVLGFEESYGYLSGSYVRDKDGVEASMLIAEMAAMYKREGKTLVDVMNAVYAEHGLYEHKLLSKEFAGADGSVKMQQLLGALRERLPEEIGGVKVIKTVDYLTQTEVELPRSNVLSFAMEDGSQVIIRPSGTEPLIKMYLTSCLDAAQNARRFELIEKWIEETFA